MFRASYFTYDGISSDTYGLQIADFDGASNPIITPAFSPVLSTIRSATGHKFHHNGVKYDKPPQHKVSVVSQSEITDTNRRAILSWLCGRESFKKLIVQQSDLENYYYLCVFTDIEIIYIKGKCHGFTMLANFDSEYMYANSPTVFSGNVPGTRDYSAKNISSDLKTGYVYPIIEFTATEGDRDVLSEENLVRQTPIGGYYSSPPTWSVARNRYIFDSSIQTGAMVRGVSFFSQADIDNQYRSYTAVASADTLTTYQRYVRANMIIKVSDTTKTRNLVMYNLSSGNNIKIDCLTMHTTSTTAGVGSKNIWSCGNSCMNLRAKPNTLTYVDVFGRGSYKVSFPVHVMMGC